MIAISPEVLAWPEGVIHERCEQCLGWFPRGRHRCSVATPVTLVEVAPKPQPAPVKKSIKEELAELEQRISNGYWPEGMGKKCYRCKHLKRLKSGRPECRIEKCKPDVMEG